MAIYDLTLSSRKENFIALDKIQLSDTNKQRLAQLLKEHKHIDKLNEYGLPVDNKILLYGHTGCGKTTTANAIAAALDKKIVTINLGGIVSSRLGETAKNMTTVFKKAVNDHSVLFLDEFDYLGKIRDYNKSDSGEMQRLVNSLIQLIDQLPNNALLIAATNHSSIIDTALLRRFQMRLKFEPPNKEELDRYYDTLLEKFPATFGDLPRNYSISYAEAKDQMYSALKKRIIAIEEENLEV